VNQRPERAVYFNLGCSPRLKINPKKNGGALSKYKSSYLPPRRKAHNLNTEIENNYGIKKSRAFSPQRNGTLKSQYILTFY